jgi:hypothetical protein
MKKIFHENPIKITLASLCILTFVGLNIWKYYAPVPIHNWNQKEISRIKVTDPKDFTFALFGDNKGDYSFFEPLLHDIGHDKEIAFAIDVGDLVSDGERGQFRRFLDQVQENLAIPFVTATGNHDFNSNNGFDNYKNIFGPTYYSFQAGECSFIVLNASTESGFDKTERQWLEDELNKAQEAKARFVFMHIPPFDPRGGTHLPEKDKKDVLELFRRFKVTHLFTSHIHGYFSGVWEGVPYTITGGAGARLQGSDPQHFFHHYMRVHVSNGKVDLTVRRINAENAIVRIYDLMEDNPIEGGLLFCAGICMLTLWLSVPKRRISNN